MKYLRLFVINIFLILLMLSFQNCTGTAKFSEIFFIKYLAMATGFHSAPPAYGPPIEQTVGPFTWEAKSWGSCQTTCGDGYESRELFCFDEGLRKAVSQKNCMFSERPETKRECFKDNSSCTKWLSSVDDFKSISESDEYICLKKSINFNDQEFKTELSKKLNNQTFNGCGHNLTKTKITALSIFNEAQDSEIINLNIKDPLIEITSSEDLLIEEAQREETKRNSFGTLLNFAQNVKLKNIKLDYNRPGVIGSNELNIKHCGALIGSGKNLDVEDITIDGDTFTFQCDYAGGFIGHTCTGENTVRLKNLKLSIKDINYLGSQIDAESGHLGGLVGHLEREPDGSTDLSHLHVHSNLHLKGGLTLVGGVVGLMSQQTNSRVFSDHSTAIEDIHFKGDIIAHGPYYNGHSSPKIGGLIGSSDANDGFAIHDSSFSGHVKLTETTPTGYHQAKKPFGKHLDIKSGVGVSRGLYGIENDDHIDLKNFSSNGEIHLELDGELDDKAKLSENVYIWRIQ